MAVMERRQIEAAERWAEGRRPDPVATVMPERRLLLAVAVAVVGATALALTPSVTDRALAERDVARAAIAVEADRLEDLADSAPEEIATDLKSSQTTFVGSIRSMRRSHVSKRQQGTWQRTWSRRTSRRRRPSRVYNEASNSPVPQMAEFRPPKR